MSEEKDVRYIGNYKNQDSADDAKEILRQNSISAEVEKIEDNFALRVSEKYADEACVVLESQEALSDF